MSPCYAGKESQPAPGRVGCVAFPRCPWLHLAAERQTPDGGTRLGVRYRPLALEIVPLSMLSGCGVGRGPGLSINCQLDVHGLECVGSASVRYGTCGAEGVWQMTIRVCLAGTQKHHRRDMIYYITHKPYCKLPAGGSATDHHSDPPRDLAEETLDTLVKRSPQSCEAGQIRSASV